MGLDWRSYEYVCIVESLLSVHGAFPKHQNVKVVEIECSIESNGLNK